MQKSSPKKNNTYPVSAVKNGVNRIIDANANRLKEGLRVCEEITRLILDSGILTRRLKTIRHAVDGLCKDLADKNALFAARRILEDVGRASLLREFKRNNYRDIFLANIQRVKESLRVLEEFSKLRNAKTAAGFKKIRYGIYDIEKKVAEKIASLSHSR